MTLYQSFCTSGPQAANHRRLLYCPRCSTPFVAGELPPFERQRCLACGFTHFLNPAPGITIILHDPEGKVLIGKRAETARFSGQWCLPGGYIELEESFIDTAHREVREETGLDIRVQGIINVVSNRLDESHHTLVIVLLGVVVGGNQAAGDDLIELRWVDRQQHQSMAYAFAADQRIIDAYFAGDLVVLPIDAAAEEAWTVNQRENSGS